MKKHLMSRLPFLWAALILVGPAVIAADKMPAEVAGEIGSPTGKISFIRDKNIWVMNATGQRQMAVSETGNADGRMSWSPDGKTIAVTRSGVLDLRGPDMMGGKHKVYDIFLVFVDSAENNNTLWWQRITSDLGSRDPEWSADGETVLFYKDMHANDANSVSPNYQVCTMSPAGDDLTILRKDWQNMTDFFMAPTMNTAGDIAFVQFVQSKQGFRPQGIARLNRASFMAPMKEVTKQSLEMSGLVAPCWSPDGKWLAYISSSINDPALYVSPPDLSERYIVFSPPPGTSLYTTAPSFSPNSKWLTFATTDGSIWISDIMGNGLKRLTGPGTDWAPAWSKAPVTTKSPTKE